MATLASDDFNRANSTNIGSDWTEENGDWEIVSNTLRKVDTFGDYFNAYWSGSFSPASADYDISADGGVDTNDFGEPCVIGRHTDSSNFYGAAIILFDNAFHTFKIVGGSYTELGSYAVSLGPDTSYSFKLSMSGTTIKGFLEGTERTSTSDSDLSSTGTPGVQMDLDGNAWVDNFLVEGVAASGGTVVKDLITSGVIPFPR